MNNMGVIFAIINLLAVVLLFLKFRNTSTAPSAPVNEVPDWAKNQIEELKASVTDKNAQLEDVKNALSQANIQSAQQISQLQANLQAAQEKLADQAKSFEQQKAQADMQIAQQKAEADIQLRREKAAAEIQLMREKQEAELQMRRDELSLETQLRAAKAMTDAEISTNLPRV